MKLEERIREAVAAEYELLRPLGAGSMGSVFLARDPALQRLVAIKVPLDELASDPVVRLRFEREALAAARINHPAVVTIHKVGRTDDGVPYLVMEYVEGRTAADLLAAEGPLPAASATDVLAQIAEALAAAHAHGVIHRDVRPANVLCDAHSGRAVLSDFGIAGILESGSAVVTRLTAEGQMLGDPTHMSPEQLTGGPLTAESDVYSFGILAFELLTGRQPYRAASASQLAQAHVHQPPRDLRDMLEGADPRLAELLARCLATEPKHRPSAEMLARRLRELQARATSDAALPDIFSDALRGVPALAAFVNELRRRRVFNVAVLYLGAAAVLLQTAQSVFPVLPLPSWSYAVLVFLTIAGFPAVLILAWIYDVTSSGLRRTEDSDSGVLAGSRGRLIALQAVGLAVALLLAVMFGYWMLKS